MTIDKFSLDLVLALAWFHIIFRGSFNAKAIVLEE